jgi:selenoprotein W-related protein
MVSKVLDEFEDHIDNVNLIPSDGGRFEFVVDGDLIYSKLDTGRHAEYEDVATPLRQRL